MVILVGHVVGTMLHGSQNQATIAGVVTKTHLNVPVAE